MNFTGVEEATYWRWNRRGFGGSVDSSVFTGWNDSVKDCRRGPTRFTSEAASGAAGEAGGGEDINGGGGWGGLRATRAQAVESPE